MDFDINKFKENTKQCCILFSDRICKSESIVNYHPDFMLNLIKTKTVSIYRKFLLESTDFLNTAQINQIKHKMDLPEKYIGWHFRYNKSWSSFRSINEQKDFDNIYGCLKEVFPDHAVLILSDRGGCNIARKMAENSHIPLHFCKDYTESFIEDCALAMDGNLFFSFNPGGLALPLFISTKPYVVFGCPVESSYHKEGFVPWKTQGQVFIPTIQLPDKEELLSILRKVAPYVNQKEMQR